MERWGAGGRGYQRRRAALWWCGVGVHFHHGEPHNSHQPRDLPPPPVDGTSPCARTCIVRGGAGCGRGLARLLGTCSHVYCGVCFVVLCCVSPPLLVMLHGACDPGPSPPASILAAQQRMYVFVFVAVEWGACEDRGACCTSTPVLYGRQLCVWFVLCRTTCDLASYRLHIDSAAVHALFWICHGEAGSVWAQGRMLHVDNGALLCVSFICVGERLFAPCVTHAHLFPPPCGQRSSVCMSLYLSRWSGLRASTGTYAARRQPSVICGDLFLLRVSGLSHHT